MQLVLYDIQIIRVTIIKHFQQNVFNASTKNSYGIMPELAVLELSASF